MTEVPKALWTPDKKIPASVLKMAWILFLESYKALLAGHANLQTWVAEDEYRACIGIARMVFKVEQENDPKT